MKRWLASLSVAMGVGAVAWGLPLGLRFAAWGARDTGGLTARDYIQDGLVAMWDGIENAGWGVHDENATNWYNLASEYEGAYTNAVATKDGRTIWGENCAIATNNYNAFYLTGDITKAIANAQTIEACVNIDSSSANDTIIFLNGRSNATYQYLCLGWYNTQSSIYAAIYRGYKFDLDIYNSTHTLVSEFDLAAVDGMVNATKSGYSDTWNNPVAISIGGRGPAYYMNGRFYCIRIYNRPLTEAEIKHNYEIDLKRFGTAGDAAE